MTIMGMYGNVGYGKNLFFTFYARQVSNMNKLLLDKGENPKYKILANFHIDLPFCEFMTVDEFLDIKSIAEKPKDEQNIKIIAGIDEPYAWGLESRRGSTALAIEATKKILQSRKFGIDPFYLAQLPSSVDKRAKFLARSVMLALPPDEFAFHYLYMGKITKVLHIQKSQAEKEIYKIYDTNETIEPLFSEDLTENDANEQLRWQQQATEQALRQITNDECMRTIDNIIIWRKLTSTENWLAELEKGGKIINKKVNKE